MKIVGISLILFFCRLMAYPALFTERDVSRGCILLVDSLKKPAETPGLGNPEFSKYSVPDVFTRSNQSKYSKELIDGLKATAQYYMIQKEYAKTLEYYFRLIDEYGYQLDVDNLAISYSEVIQLFISLKDIDLAEKYLAMMTRELQNVLTPAAQAHIFFSKASCFYFRKEYDPSIQAYYLSIYYFQKAHDINREGSVYRYLADAYIQKNMISYAEYNYHIAENYFRQIPNPADIAMVYTKYAFICMLRNKQKRSLEYNLSAMRIREKYPHSSLVANSYLNVGEAYWSLGMKDSARLYLHKALGVAEKFKKYELLEPINLSLYKYAKDEKKYREALKYFVECMDSRNKKNQDRNKSDILVFETNHTIRNSEIQNDIMNKEVLIQELTSRNRRIQIFIFEVAFLLMLAFIFAIDTLSRKNHKRKNELKELNMRLTSEIQIRIEAERMLSRSEELHRFLAENMVDVISLMDHGMRRLYISPSCEKFYGYSSEEILKMNSPLELVEPFFHVSVNQRLLEMLRSKKSVRYIYKVLRKNGSTFWAESIINPILDPATNDVQKLITVVRDISGRMKYEEELSENSRQKEYLLREIHNRVKNNFAILISLMNMQRDQSSNTELGNSLTDLKLRVRTMSLVHEQLYQTQEISVIPFDNYLQHLAQIISSSFNNSRIRLLTEIAPCRVVIEMALPLGLIINELITNAFKYAFPGNRTGNIWVRLLPENEEKFCVSICDDGIGLPADFTMNSAQSMGSQIVGILVEQIEATLEVSGKGGACFRILFATKQE